MAYLHIVHNVSVTATMRDWERVVNRLDPSTLRDDIERVIHARQALLMTQRSSSRLYTWDFDERITMTDLAPDEASRIRAAWEQ